MGVLEDFIAAMSSSEYYDNSLAAAARNALSTSSDLEAQLKMGKENLLGEYELNKFNIQDALDKALIDLSHQFGGNGLARSTINLDAQSRTNQEAQKQLQEAAFRKTQGIAGLEQGKRSALTELLNSLNTEQANATGRYAASQHQRSLEEQQANYQREMLEMQRQAQANQSSAMRQQAAAQRQMASSQQNYYSKMASMMQPKGNSQGQYSYAPEVRPAAPVSHQQPKFVG